MWWAADAPPTAPGWALTIITILSIAAGGFGLYKGFIDTGTSKKNTLTDANKGTIDGMAELNERLTNENLRLGKRVDVLDEALRLMLTRVRKLEDILHAHGIEIPNDE